MAEKKAEISSAIAAGKAVGRIAAEAMDQLEIEMLRNPLLMWRPKTIARALMGILQKTEGGEKAWKIPRYL